MSNARNLADLLGTNSTVQASKIAAVNASALPAGSILQVKHAVKTDTQTVTINLPNWVDVSNLSVSITPSSTNSKIFVMYSVQLGNGADSSHGYIKAVRDTTVLDLGDGASNRTRSASVTNTGHVGQMYTISNSFLDSPSSTSALTYKIQASTNNTNSNANYINRSSRDTDNTGYDGRGISTLTVMEVAG